MTWTPEDEPRLRQEAIERAEAGENNGWLPIETAPWDGTYILSWQPSDASPAHAIVKWDGRKWVERDGSWFVFAPHFWQPLPQPPKKVT